MQVESFLEDSARRMPRKTALVCGARRLTYAQLERLSNRLAHALIAAGVERGDRVAVHLDNSVEAVVSIFAVLKAGAVVMMVNPATKPGKLAYLLNHARAHTVILSARKAVALQANPAELPHLGAVVYTPTAKQTPSAPGKHCVALDDLLEQHAGDERPPKKRAIDLDLAALLYTSGSTGKPKGVMLSHFNMVSSSRSITTYLENTPDDVILNVLPLSFGYGLSQVLTAARVGGTLVLEQSFAYSHAVIEKIIQEKATGFPLVPTLAAVLLQMDLTKYDLSRLRYITSAAAALPTEHIVQLRNLLPHVKIYVMYGQTECTRVTYLPPAQIDDRPTSVGRGMPNEEVYIVDRHDRRVGPNVVGELVVRGSHVMRGYWELPDQTDRKLRPGLLPGEKVLYTGDLFRMDHQGYLYFVGRKDDIIKCGGEKVSPKEVEDILYSHPAVAEAAVVGVPDRVLGQAIKAFVALKDDRVATERELARHCAAHLESFMVPQFVEFRDSLPKSSNGKIQKQELIGATP